MKSYMTNEEKEVRSYGIFELRDGLTLKTIKAKYPWLLLADMRNAILGTRSGNLVWYGGTWYGVTWYGGYWKGEGWDGCWAKYPQLEDDNLNKEGKIICKKQKQKEMMQK